MLNKFLKSTNGFTYYYSESIPADTTVILKMPITTPNRRGVNDIGFAADDGIRMYAALTSMHDDESIIWQEINPFDEVNKTVSWIKIVNTTDTAKRVNIKVVMF